MKILKFSLILCSLFLDLTLSGYGQQTDLQKE